MIKIIYKYAQRVPQRLWNLLDRLPIDNKLLAGGLTYGLTSLVTTVGLKLDGFVFPGLTVGQGVAAVVAAFIAWKTANEGSLLRNPPLAGHPVLPEGFDPDHAPESPQVEGH